MTDPFSKIQIVIVRKGDLVRWTEACIRKTAKEKPALAARMRAMTLVLLGNKYPDGKWVCVVAPLGPFGEQEGAILAAPSSIEPLDPKGERK